MSFRFLSIFSLIISSIVSIQVRAQFTMESYLQTAFYDQDLEMYHAQLDFLDNNKYNSPWLNRVEFRVGTEDANLSMDEFRLRLSPTNPSEIKANKVYHTKQISSINAGYTVALNKALKNRYQLLLDHFYLTQLLNIRETKKEQYLLLISNLHQIGLDGFDTGNLISVESDISDLMMSIEEIKMELHELVFYMALDLPASGNIKWDSLSIITVEQIQLFMDNEKPMVEDENIYVKEAEEERILNEQMFKIDKSESKSNIGYLQGNFEPDRGQDFEDHFGIQIGVRLPIVNPDKPDLNRDKFDLIKDEKEVDATKLLVSRRSELLLIRMDHLFSQHQLVSQRIQQSANIMTTSPLKGNIDVLEIIKKRNYQADLQKKQLDIKKEVIDTFIDYLDIKGHLVQTPIKNFMSSALSIIDG